MLIYYDNSINLNNVFDDADLIYSDELAFGYSGDTHIVVEISVDGIVTLTPNTNWNGSETITFTATDNYSEFVSDEVIITINPINDAPTFDLPTSFTFAEDDQLIEDFANYSNDIDFDDLTLTVSGFSSSVFMHTL